MVFGVCHTFMPISIGDMSAKGTSRVASSHISTAKLHMSAARRLISDGFLFSAKGMNRLFKKKKIMLFLLRGSRTYCPVFINPQWTVTVRIFIMIIIYV